MLSPKAQNFDRLVIAIDVAQTDRAVHDGLEQHRVEEFQVIHVKRVERARGKVHKVVGPDVGSNPFKRRIKG